jgi:hypothetical protein
MILESLSFKINLLPVLVKMKLNHNFLSFHARDARFDQIDPPNLIFQNNSTSGFGESETKVGKYFVEKYVRFNEINIIFKAQVFVTYSL